MNSKPLRRLGAGLVTLGVFVWMLLAWKTGQEEISGQPASEKPKVRPAGDPVSWPANLASFSIHLGLKDQKATDWSGTVAVSEGKILKVEIVQGGAMGKKAGKAKAKGTKFNVASAVVKKAAKKDMLNRPVIRVSLDAPANAKLELKTAQGNFSFPLSDITYGEEKRFMDGQAAVNREEGGLILTDAATEDDYPALARAPDGTLWLAYIEYQKSKGYVTERVLAGNFEDLVPTAHGDQIRLKSFNGKEWSPCLDVTDTGLDIWRPTVTVDGKGLVHIAWAQQVDGNWDIYHRTYNPSAKKEKQWSNIDRISANPGADFHVVSTTDASGRVWLAWQSWGQGRDGGWFSIAGARIQVSDEIIKTSIFPVSPTAGGKGPANCWSPAITADAKGNVYIAYDTYENENYDVRLVVFDKEGNLKNVVDPGRSPRYEARPNIVCDKNDRVWIAYEEGDEQWGKDYSTNQFKNIGFKNNPGYALYINRTVRVKCLEDGKLKEPAADLQKALARYFLESNKSVPRLASDAQGGLWLTFRHHPLATGAGEVWNSYAFYFDGKNWLSPRRLAGSANLMDNRPALAPFNKGIVAVYSGDNRTKSQDRPQFNLQADLYAAMLHSSGPVHAPELAADAPPGKAKVNPVHPDETAQVERIRNYRIEHQGKKLRLLRGEFHRHTEFTAHRDQDGLLEDVFRYGLDAARMDWIGDGDHDNGFHDEYSWWQIQKMTDLYHHAPHFISVHSHERSNVYPNGHRNVIMPKRGIRPLPRGDLMGSPEKGTPDTKLLYAYLKKFGGICSSHTSGTNMGTDWRDNDPVVEPVVEIYQGHRHNYEHFGAPRSATADTQIGGYQPKGFVWNAFEKGYKFGFQASSDHVSTHMSYAVVLTDDASRTGLIEAFKKRHSYAATDNIILDVRSGEHIMGDIFKTPKRPVLDIRVIGTGPIAKIHVIRDMKYVYTDTPQKAEVKLAYTDMDAQPGSTHFYYIRVEQADGNLAWSSPMWITFAGK